MEDTVQRVLDFKSIHIIGFVDEKKKKEYKLLFEENGLEIVYDIFLYMVVS